MDKELKPMLNILLTQAHDYKESEETNFRDVRNTRGVCAIIALCMVDLTLFQTLWGACDYWQCNLRTAGRFFVSKISLPGETARVSMEYRNLRDMIQKNLLPIRKQLLLNPARINYKLDIGTIEQMLKQAVDLKGKKEMTQ